MDILKMHTFTKSIFLIKIYIILVVTSRNNMQSFTEISDNFFKLYLCPNF